MCARRWAVLALLLSASGAACAALLDEARVVSASESLVVMLPPPSVISISTAGAYTLTLTDLGRQGGFANPFGSLSALITQGGQLIKRVILPTSGTTISDSVVLAAGSFQLQIIGATNGASQYGASLTGSANAAVWSISGSINAPPTRNFSVLKQELTAVAGHIYSVSLQDRAFPAALASLALLVTQGGVKAGTCDLLTAGNCSFMAIGGKTQLTVLATEAPGSAGLYSVKVADGGIVSFASSLPVGDMPAAVAVTLPAGDNYSLTSADLHFPASLSAFGLALVQDGELLLKQLTPATAAFPAVAGPASLYVISKPASNSSGLYSIDIRRGATGIYSKTTAVDSPSAPGVSSFVYSFAVSAAGSYALQLRDFAVPQPLLAIAASVAQGGNVLGTMSGTGTLNFSVPQAGELTIAVRATTGIGTDAQGLFGLSLTAPGSPTALLEQNQGVGGSFMQTPLNITSAQRYALTVTDFAAPAAMDQLIVTLTRGSQQPLGTIYGGGTLVFDAVAGAYSLNVLTKLPAGASFGSYGAIVANPPTVSFSVSAPSVASGSFVTLNWSSTDATSCAASGAWSGSKATSGSAAVGPLTAGATYTLACSGLAGSVTQSVPVTIQAVAAPAAAGAGGAAGSGGGGGAISLLTTMALGLLLLVRSRRWRLTAATYGAALVLSTAAIAAATPAAPSMAELKAKLQQRFASIDVQSVAPSAIWPGLYEVVTPTELAFTNVDGSLLFAGQIVDTNTRENLSGKRWNELNRIDVSTLPLDHAMKLVKGNGRRVLYLFSDPDCPFCQEQEKELQDIGDVTIYTFLYPLESIHPDARAKADTIWCSAERNRVWAEWMLRKVLPVASCEQQVVVDNIALGSRLRINSTPIMFLADGSRVSGVTDHAVLDQALDASQAAVQAQPQPSR